tara:strand:- start:326 stop:862 length:537 start_codon:yes stop_codon:yes gene_type:complete
LNACLLQLRGALHRRSLVIAQPLLLLAQPLLAATLSCTGPFANARACSQASTHAPYTARANGHQHTTIGTALRPTTIALLGCAARENRCLRCRRCVVAAQADAAQQQQKLHAAGHRATGLEAYMQPVPWCMAKGKTAGHQPTGLEVYMAPAPCMAKGKDAPSMIAQAAAEQVAQLDLH